jgi:membrane fusion protein, multidrug efflux system
VSTSTPARGRALLKPLLIVIVLMSVLLGAIFGFQAFKGKMIGKFMAQSAAAPQTVTAVAAKPSNWQAQMQASGTLRAVRGADLSAQAAGVVDEIKFNSGNSVAAGAVLLRLRLNDDDAKLQQLQAASELAAQTLKRDQEQFAAQAVSQATIDTDVSSLKSARAQVVAQQALIEEKVVRAPFAGTLGIRQVDLGQFLSAGATIVTLQALDPILIDFYLPQQALSNIKLGQMVSAAIDTYPGTAFGGVIESINSKVDTASRNVQVRATFHNADHRLVPGMYANVSVNFGQTESHLTLPVAAITYNPYGDTVYVVEHGGSDADGKPNGQPNGQPKLTARQRFVKLGQTRGDQVAVLSGVKEDEIIVVGGQIKLRNGVSVVVDNSVKPTETAAPTPPNE